MLSHPTPFFLWVVEYYIISSHTYGFMVFQINQINQVNQRTTVWFITISSPKSNIIRSRSATSRTIFSKILLKARLIALHQNIDFCRKIIIHSSKNCKKIRKYYKNPYYTIPFRRKIPSSNRDMLSWWKTYILCLILCITWYTFWWYSIENGTQMIKL